MKKKRISLKKLIEIETALSSLPHPLRVEREGKGPVRVFDEEGNTARTWTNKPVRAT